MSLKFCTKSLVNRNGIWYSRRQAVVSYPDQGNEISYRLEDESFWFRHRNNCIKEVVKKFRPVGAFYDVGGGNGFVAKAIKEIGVETVLIEPGEKGCINARSRYISNIVCSTIEDAGFEKASMSAIGVFDVVEHFEDDMYMLAVLRDHLQQNGLLFISVPAYEFLWSHEDDFAGHHNRYTTSGLSGKLKEVGFGILYATYIFSVLPVPVFLSRTLPSRLGLKKRSAYVDAGHAQHRRNSCMLDRVWSWELSRIRQGAKIPMGGSCVVVAAKL